MGGTGLWDVRFERDRRNYCSVVLFFDFGPVSWFVLT